MIPQIVGQANPEWAAMDVGFSKEKSADVGCVLAGFTASVNALTGQMLTPRDVNEMAKAANRFTKASLHTTDLAPLLACKKTPSIDKTRVLPTLKGLIREALAEEVDGGGGVTDDKGRPGKGGGLALIRIDYDLTTPQTTNHTIVCYASSVDKNGRETWACMDPAGAGKYIELDGDLFVQRTAKRKYFAVGVAPMYRAYRIG